MTRTATIQARIDPQTKRRAQDILDKLHISLSEAVAIFLTQVVYQNGIPFEIKLPNAVTARTLNKVEAGEDLHEVANVEELVRELES